MATASILPSKYKLVNVPILKPEFKSAIVVGIPGEFVNAVFYPFL